MNKVERIEREFVRALRMYPMSDELYNDYAMFLYRHKNDYNMAIKLLQKALRINPQSKIYRYNYNKIINSTKARFTNYHNFLVFLIFGIMVWLGFYGYNNLMNMASLFLLAQIIMNYQKNMYRKEKSVLW